MRIYVCFGLMFVAASALAENHAPQAKQFLDKTFVTYPRQLGEYVLDHDKYDPANLSSGVSLDYRLPGEPEGSAFDIFVFPQGRASQEIGLKRALADITDGVLEAQRQHIYENVVLGDAVEFTVAAPPNMLDSGDKTKPKPPIVVSPASPAAPTSEAPPAQAMSEDPFAGAVEAAAPPTTTVGRKVLLTFSTQGIPEQSVGYAFYRNLFLITVRFTSPVGRLSPAQFQALADQAVQALVPAIDVKSFGTCGTLSIPMGEHEGSGDKEESKAAALAMIREIGRIATENCGSSEGDHPDPVAADHARQILVYPEKFWD